MDSMGKKADKFGFVFSTDNDFEFDHSEEEVSTPDPSEQILRVLIDRKSRKGKTVTLIKGFVGSSEDRDQLCKFLKSKCGVGGSVKDDEIIIQGEKKKRIIELLIAEGYSKTKGAGGN